jgi:hypothetical protein
MMMEEVRTRFSNRFEKATVPRIYQMAAVKGLARTWRDPYKFLYDPAKSCRAHHDKLDANVV